MAHEAARFPDDRVKARAVSQERTSRVTRATARVTSWWPPTVANGADVAEEMRERVGDVVTAPRCNRLEISSAKIATDEIFYRDHDRSLGRSIGTRGYGIQFGNERRSFEESES